ncbi:MAG TPA: SpoIID/LytB domain-containing protein [Frankiaceae bacterium]|nr:SpoIID/LytB domain-containing protein [Frankiaceae bacterium]
MRAVRVLASALVAGLVGATLATLPASPATALDEVYTRPADGVFQVEGHGWGHGHGLNQWGAEGAARQGVLHTAILDHYYPGTAQAAKPARAIRVLLSEDDHTDVVVRAVSGLEVRDRASGAVYTLPAGPSRWRLIQTSAGQRIQSYNGSWTTWATGGKSAWTGPLQFEGTAPLRLYFADGSAREYRGVLRAVKTGTSTINVVNVLDLEQYLYGVVPRESPSWFKAEALKAQAIAARSYSTYKLDHVSSSATYDICSTIMCQVYGGVRLVTSGGTVHELEQASTTGAVNATKGVVRTYNGAAIFAEFSSSNGGWSTQGSFAYLAPRADPWDKIASPSHYWTATLSAAQLERKYPAVGRLLRIRVTRRDGNGEWGGRVKEVRLEGVSSSGAATYVNTTGGGVYGAHTWPASSTGLRGSWWHIKTPYTASIVGKSATPTLIRPPGASTARLAVHYKNTGSIAWPVSGLHLAVSSPAGAADPLAGGSTRPGAYVRNITTPGATSVKPGEAARFEVPLNADGINPGTYRQAYRLRIGSGAVFGPEVAWFVPVVRPVFTSSVVALAGPATAASGDAPPAVWKDGTVVVPRSGSTSLQVKVKNTGNVDWPLKGAVQLVTSDPRGRESVSAGSTWPSKSVAARASAVEGVSGATVVKPGQTAIFPVTINGNGRTVGLRPESFEVKWSGWAWVAGSQVTLKVVRVDPSLSRVSEKVSQPAAMSLLAYPGDKRVMVMRVRNLGGNAWPVGGGEVIATSDGREDALRTTSWLTSRRATPLAANVSRPGVTSVHPGEVAEYRVPIDPTNKPAGVYGEWFRAMVASSGTRYGATVGADVTISAATMAGTVTRNTTGLSVPAGGTATYSIDVKNTGNTTWRVGSAVRVSVKGSGSAHSSWINAGRPTAIDKNVSRAGATDVRPGERARFTFTIAANGRAPGSYTETFGCGWEAWRSTGLRIPVSYVIV